MATTPYFHWPSRSSSSAGAAASDLVAGFGSDAPEMSPPATADAGALVSPERAVAAARPRTRRNSSGSGKHQAPGSGGGGAKKPPQRGLGVAELERLRCGGDPLRDLAAGAQVHPLMHCNHHHASAASAFDARYSPSLLAAIQTPPPAAPPRPAGPGCYVHHPAAAHGCQRCPPALASEQQYFMDWCGRMGPGFSPTGNGAGVGEHHQATQLLPPPLAPEHPSSQSTIWRPAASSSSCLQSGHRCDLCVRRMMRAFAERGAPPSPTGTAVPDYSIYDLAAAMATAHQGGEATFVVRDRMRAALPGEEPAKKEVREIEFFPAVTTRHAGLDESEIVAPAVSSSYGSPPLDLSLKL